MSNSIEDCIASHVRPEVLALSAYHVPPSTGLLKLDAMENPYPLPVEVQQELAQQLAGVAMNRYPDPEAQALQHSLRHAMHIPEGVDLMLGNGSDELIQVLAMACAKPGAVLLAPEPSFVMYRMIAIMTGMRYVGVPLQDDFELDLVAMQAAIREHQPALVFLAYPNNPTGNTFHGEAVHQIIDGCPGLVVVDEAYHAFAEDSMLDYVSTYPNLVVMRTLSKLGLAGVRLGYMMGAPAWMEQFNKIRLPYNINVLTQKVGQFLLDRPEILLEQAQKIKAQRAVMMAALLDLPNCTPYPSAANFILVRLPRARATFEQLLQRGILVKCLDGGHPLLRDCLRLTIGTADENQRLLQTLQDILHG